MDHDWTGSTRYEDHQALAVVLRELLEDDLVDGRARLRASLCIAWSQEARDEMAQLGDLARDLLALADASGDLRTLADAQCLNGDVLQTLGQLSDAQAAVGESLAITRRLAGQDPSNASWQRELAVGCWRVARVLNQSGRLQDALPLYEEAARIFAELVERFPDFAAWHGERDAVERGLKQCRTTVRTIQ